MNYNKVNITGVTTSKIRVLTADEKNDLLIRCKKGDRDARAEMIDGNLRLVLSAIQRFSGRGENLDDLFQVGCVGLIKAVDNFNTDLNVQFSTYAVPMIIEWRDNNINKKRSILSGQPGLFITLVINYYTFCLLICQAVFDNKRVAQYEARNARTRRRSAHWCYKRLGLFQANSSVPFFRTYESDPSLYRSDKSKSQITLYPGLK